MSVTLTNQYIKFYEHFSKQYGAKTCVMMQVGKFFELYDYCDHSSIGAETKTPIKQATTIMNIVLKEKQGGFLEAGVPEQSLHKFAQTLTKQGWTVVVVEQEKNSSDEVTARNATRVLSPGTHTETATQDRMTVASLWISAKSSAASVTDLTTGEVFSYETTHLDELQHMFQVYGVREVLCVKENSDLPSFSFFCPCHFLTPETFSVFLTSSFRREEYFRKCFKTKTLLPIRSVLNLQNSESSPVLELALILLLRFVEDHFPQQSEKLTSHSIYSPEKHMRLSNNILEQLNILNENPDRQSVLQLLERTHSGIGKRALRERILRPITNEKELQTRWRQVAWAKDLSLQQRRELERILKALYDIPRLHYRLAEGKIESADVIQLFQSYSATISLIENLRKTPLTMDYDLEENIKEYRNKFRKLLDEEKAIERSSDKFVGFLTPLSGPKTSESERKIDSLFTEWNEKWKLFCSLAKINSDSFSFVRKGIADSEYAWEGPRSSQASLKTVSQNQSILTNIEIDNKKAGPITFSCKEFQTFSEKVRTEWNKLNKYLKEESNEVCDDLWTSVKGIQTEWVEWLGRVDVTLALGSVASEWKWCSPEIGDHLKAEGLRHPLLEAVHTRVEYVSHTVELGGEKGGGWLIYGVNASGKSSLMKSVGIACILAQAGSFVPATSFTLRPYDAAFSRIWSHDNVWAGLSSFAVEVCELKDILEGATEKSLILGDEVCSGTESSSATALVASVLEHLDSINAHFMFATHLHDLIKIPGFLPRKGISVWHLKVERTPEGKLIYNRKLQPGPGSSSYGLEVASAMGIPFTLMERAYGIRRLLEGEAQITEAPKSTWNSNIQRQECEICGCKLVKELEVHHIEERVKGGSNNLRNLVVLCESCHDKHHGGEIEVGSIVQTSEGQERQFVEIPFTQVNKEESPKKQSKKKWSEEEVKLIEEMLEKYKGRPLTRTILALEECGIKINQVQLKKFRL
jgi:DNA mismatch repair protein MutS